MKALKEKRLSLRSFLRGGIVILSLLALAFAIVACNTSGGDEPDTTNPPGTTPVTPTDAPPIETEPPRYALSIELITKPSGDSYQGQTPNLSGIKLRVLWSNSPVAEYYDGVTEMQAAGLQVSPARCDKAGKAAETFHIYAQGTGSKESDGFTLNVIPIYKLDLTGSYKWYYGKNIPDWTGVTAKALYAYDKDASGADADYKYNDSSWATMTEPYAYSELKDLPLDASYPPYYLSADGKKVSIAIWKTAEPTPPITATNWLPTVNATYGRMAQTTGTITSVIDFRYVAGSGKNVDDWWDYEDHWAVQSDKDKTFKYAQLGQNATVSKNLFNKMKAAKLTFQVLYPDGSDWVDLDWNTYEYWMQKIYGTDYDKYFNGGANIETNTPFVPNAPYPSGSTNPYYATSGNGNDFTYEIEYLIIDDDDNWVFSLNFLRADYNGGVVIPAANVALPVYSYSDVTDATRIYTKQTANIMVPYRKNATGLADPMAALDLATVPVVGPGDYAMIGKGGISGLSSVGNLMSAIKDYWQLTATYRRRGQPKTRVVTFVNDWFQAFTSGTFGVDLQGRNDSDIANALNGTGSAIQSGVILWDRAWYLPFNYPYRESQGSFSLEPKEEDQGVWIDLYSIGLQP